MFYLLTFNMFCLFLRTFGAVLGAALPTIADAGAIERPADSVIPDSGQILDAAAADKYHRVLLQIMAFAADLARHFVTVGQADSAHLAQRRIRLLWRRRVDPRAHAALLRRRGQRRNLGLPGGFIAAGADQLCRRRHKY